MKVGYHLLFHCVLCLVVAQPEVADRQIAAAGTTNWQIVRSADASGVDLVVYGRVILVLQTD